MGADDMVDQKRTRKIRADRMIRQRDDVARVMTTLTDRALREVERRSEHTASPDGFPSGGTGGGGSSSSDVTSTTEMAALRLVEGRHPADPQMTAAQHLASAMHDAWTAAIQAEHAWDMVCNITDMRRGREVTLGTCQACLRDDVPNVGNDRIRAGYCLACYTAWLRTADTDSDGHRQDRHTFEGTRRTLEVVEGRRTGYAPDELDGLVQATVLPGVSQS